MDMTKESRTFFLFRSRDEIDKNLTFNEKQKDLLKKKYEMVVSHFTKKRKRNEADISIVCGIDGSNPLGITTYDFHELKWKGWNKFRTISNITSNIDPPKNIDHESGENYSIDQTLPKNSSSDTDRSILEVHNNKKEIVRSAVDVLAAGQSFGEWLKKGDGEKPIPTISHLDKTILENEVQEKMADGYTFRTSSSQIPLKDPFLMRKGWPSHLRARRHEYRIPRLDKNNMGHSILYLIQGSMRLHDNYGLSASCWLGKHLNLPVVAISFFEAGHCISEINRKLTMNASVELKNDLNRLGIPFIGISIETNEQIEENLKMISHRLQTHIIIVDELFLLDRYLLIQNYFGSANCGIFGIEASSTIPVKVMKVKLQDICQQNIDLIDEDKFNQIYSNHTDEDFLSQHDTLVILDKSIQDQVLDANVLYCVQFQLHGSIIQWDQYNSTMRGNECTSFKELQKFLDSSDSRAMTQQELRGGGLSKFITLIRQGSLSARTLYHCLYDPLYLYKLMEEKCKLSKSISSPPKPLPKAILFRARDTFLRKFDYHTFLSYQWCQKVQSSFMQTKQSIYISRNFCDYWSLFASPWIYQTLMDHANDERFCLEDVKNLENGSTHDMLWNAIQHFLICFGYIHPSLLPYWGKKIFEWSCSPNQCLLMTSALLRKFCFGSMSSSDIHTSYLSRLFHVKYPDIEVNVLGTLGKCEMDYGLAQLIKTWDQNSYNIPIE